jgi:translation initiation factor 2B subunit (eIF-2B alpha/beta/delta family)
MAVSAQTLIDAIRRDNRSGAIQLTSRAGEALLAWPREAPKNRSLHETRSALGRFALELVGAKPPMAPIFNLVNQTLLAVDEARSFTGFSQRLEATVRQFIETLEHSTAQIATQAAKLIKPNATVMTISYSATAFAAFRHALSAGKRFTVICPESRPICEGRALARDLAQLGLRVKLIADAAAPALVRDCDLVLVGGDALTPKGLINKIGSYGLALAARASACPFATLLGQQKYLLRFREDLLSQEPAEELWLEGRIENLSVQNRYFELVPLELLTQVISGTGSVQPGTLLKRWQAIRLHPILEAVL